MDAVTEDLGSQWIAEHFFLFSSLRQAFIRPCRDKCWGRAGRRRGGAGLSSAPPPLITRQVGGLGGGVFTCPIPLPNTTLSMSGPG